MSSEQLVRAVFYAVVFCIPLETLYVLNLSGSTDPNAGGITFSKLIGLILFGLALVEWRRCFRRIPATFWMIAWYLLALTMSELWIPRSLSGWFYQVQFTVVQMAGLFLISANLFADPEFRGSILEFYGWWASLVAVGMLLGVTGGAFGENRDTVLGQDPNMAAAYFAMGAVCIAGNPRIFASKWMIPRMILSPIAIVASILAILQTGSRGGLIAFAAGISALAVCGGKATRLRRSCIAAAVIAVLGFMIVREFQHGTNTAARLTASWNDGDTAGRTTIYDAAWAMVLEKPLMGYGGANNLFTLGTRLNETTNGIFGRDTHNLLLAVLTEVGLVGAVPFLLAILYAMWIAWRHGTRTGDALPFALMCVQVLVNTSVTGHREKLFWIVFAAAAACGMPHEAAEKAEARRIMPTDGEASAL
ncbi:MAG TPA: O-antigen ligase family protein [Elusimicrobiota bacterium]|nr:O-antigen ligase family protein [Elusimicrobiota bacterium]